MKVSTLKALELVSKTRKILRRKRTRKYISCYCFSILLFFIGPSSLPIYMKVYLIYTLNVLKSKVGPANGIINNDGKDLSDSIQIQIVVSFDKGVCGI